jgi:hypothetical protein
MGGDSTRAVYPLFQTEDGGAIPTSPLQLTFFVLDIKRALILNRLWHSRLPNLGLTSAARLSPAVSYGAEYQDIIYAVAIWTAPIARMLNGKHWIELRRMAIASDAPHNTASRMLGWMIRDIRNRFPEVVKAISYQDMAVHKGTIYRASGWKIGNKSEGGEWSRPSRYVSPMQTISPKIRWELDMQKS